jgi:hypothetical protein
MILVYLKQGDCVEIPEVVRTERVEGRLLCFDADNRLVRGFLLSELTLFTLDDGVAEVIREEVCEEEEPPTLESIR